MREICSKFCIGSNIPLPPYIERKMQSEDLKKFDMDRYQTVYAKDEGSVAAPTAGLHFTTEILDKLKAKGVEIIYVTLNVGWALLDR